MSKEVLLIQLKIIERALALPSQQRVITLPRALAMDTSIDPRAKALYMCLIAHKPRSIRELAACASMNRDVTTRMIHILVEKGWVIVKKYGCNNIMIPTQPPEIQKANLDYIRACERVHPGRGKQDEPQNRPNCRHKPLY